MAHRPKAYGLTAEVNAKISKKYDLKAEQQALAWMGELLEDRYMFEKVEGEDATHEKLKDGVILCRIMNVLQPNSIRKINTRPMPFLMMENIGAFLSACSSYGCNPADLFQTVDLYEKQNMHAVISGLHALGRKAQSKGFYGPVLGPRESEQNVRMFSEETLRAGRTTIGLQMGSNKGANQSGMNFGKARYILD